jgi:hypothetical protein
LGKRLVVATEEPSRKNHCPKGNPEKQGGGEEIMRTLGWHVGCVAIALAALVSYPAAGFGAIDCSYGGAFDPPLQDVDPADQFCEIFKSRKALGTVFIDVNNPLEFLGETSLNVSQELPITPPGSPSLPQGTFFIFGGIVQTIIQAFNPLTQQGPILINARGEIRNTAGIMYLTAPADQMRLKASLSILLNGPNFGDPITFPSTLLQGDPVKLESEKGNIEINNTAIVNYQKIMDMLAPRGNIAIHNSAIFVIDDAGGPVGGLGICRFQVKKGIGQVIGLPGTPTEDPTNIFVCVPQVIKK